MFEDRSRKRTFFSAPQSITSLVAAFLEPTLSVLAFVIANQWMDEPMGRPQLTLCLLVFALTFPGPNRFRDGLLSSAVDIVSSWVSLLFILAMCAYATSSFYLFEDRVLMGWALATPVVQLVACWLGQQISKQRSARPQARRRAVVVGAGRLGIRVSQAITARPDDGVDFVGFFDDRTDERVDEPPNMKRLGGLANLATYVIENGISEVYITLPLGSQPRIVALLEPSRSREPRLRSFTCPMCSASASSKADCKTLTAFPWSAFARRPSPARMDCSSGSVTSCWPASSWC
jgi:putative colanic acid biosynthesis UDP-glucose lipid carrier transferase